MTPGEFRNIYGEFGFSEALLVHDEILSYLAPLDDDYYLLSLDTAWYQDNAALGRSGASGILVPSLFGFTENALDLASEDGKKVIVMTHHNFLRHYEIDFDLSTFNLTFGFDDDEGREILDYNRKIGFERTYRGQYDRLIGDYSEDEARAMADYFYLANLYAQQGLEAYYHEEIFASEGSGWFRESTSFLKGLTAALPLGWVYYIDHLPIGAFVDRILELWDDVYHYFPRDSVRAMKEYILARWGKKAVSKECKNIKQGQFTFNEAAETV